MALDPRLVQFTMELCSRSVPVDAAKDLAATLELREELLAYLFLRTDFLTKNPDIGKALEKLAKEHGYRAATRRETAGLPTAARSLVSEFQEAMVQTITSNPEQHGALTRLDELDRLLAQYDPTSSSLQKSPERWIRS